MILSSVSFDGRKSEVLRSPWKVPEGHQREPYGRVPSGPIRCLELELEGELDGGGTADLVEGVEAAIGAAGA